MKLAQSNVTNSKSFFCFLNKLETLCTMDFDGHGTNYSCYRQTACSCNTSIQHELQISLEVKIKFYYKQQP